MSLLVAPPIHQVVIDEVLEALRNTGHFEGVADDAPPEDGIDANNWPLPFAWLDEVQREPPDYETGMGHVYETLGLDVHVAFHAAEDYRRQARLAVAYVQGALAGCRDALTDAREQDTEFLPTEGTSSGPVGRARVGFTISYFRSRLDPFAHDQANTIR